jgi:hypothetical protein
VVFRKVGSIVAYSVSDNMREYFACEYDRTPQIVHPQLGSIKKIFVRYDESVGLLIFFKNIFYSQDLV